MINNTTYRILVEKLGASQPTQFVGNEGEIFYDPNIPSLSLSDGSTVGGLVIGGGTQGLQGIQGTQGVQGLQGRQGTQGVQGIQGTQGVQGLQGTQGTQGVQGIQGTDGNQGTYTGSWTVSINSGTYSFTAPTNANYVMWMRGSIPDGICIWNATVSISNTNVPVIGNQYGWYYTAGNQLVLTAIPSQIIGTSGSISTSSPAVSNSNIFSFGITNNSGTNQTVFYGYKTI